MKRHVFFISDGTGITAETFGHTLLTQFESIEFTTTTLPYIDSVEKATACSEQITEKAQQNNHRPLVFSTLVNRELNAIINQADCKHFDFLSTFIEPMEKEFKVKSSHTMGKSHGLSNYESYKMRIDAVNFALSHDDGIKPSGYNEADVILVGVSRCGKTPTCLYMALQFGILSANYPFTDDVLSELRLPKSLQPYKQKCFGLTINVERLAAIRAERRPNSEYASMERCRREVQEVEAMYRRNNIPFLNTTHYSIEEISTKIMAITGINRRVI